MADRKSPIVKYTPKPHVFEKPHLDYFTPDELASAYRLVMPEDEARASAEVSFKNPEGVMLVGDTFAMLATVSLATAERVAELLEEPLDVVFGLRDELLERLADAGLVPHDRVERALNTTACGDAR